MLEPLQLDLDLPQRYRPGTIRAVCEATGSVRLNLIHGSAALIKSIPGSLQQR